MYFIGWAPHHSQPKPLKPGSAKASFKDLAKHVPPGDVQKTEEKK